MELRGPILRPGVNRKSMIAFVDFCCYNSSMITSAIAYSDPEKECIIMWKTILFIAVAALIAGVAIYNFIRSKKIRRNGVEADAVVSRIEESSSPGNEGGVDFTYTYYVTYKTQDGCTVDAQLNHAPGYTRVGESVRIKYLPEKPHHAVLVK